MRVNSLHYSSEEIMNKILFFLLNCACLSVVHKYVAHFRLKFPFERFVSAAHRIGAEHVESCGARKLSDFPDGWKIPVSG